MENKYTKTAMRKNIFVSTTVSLDELIGIESIESMYDFTLDCGDHIYSMSDDNIYEFDEVRKNIITEFNLTKNEIENNDLSQIVKSVLANQYRSNYENELYDEYVEHIDNQCSNVQYHFEGKEDFKSVHLSEAKWIRIGLTKNQFETLFENDKQYYDTKEEFFEDAVTILDEYISSFKQYDNEHFFDYYGTRVSCDGWEDSIKEVFAWELEEILKNRTKHTKQVKQWIKNKVPFVYRSAC